jgi:hypothetical protein
MNRNHRLAFNALTKLGVPVYERCDIENFQISAEHPDSYKFCNYYSNREDWIFGVSPVIEDTLRKYGLHAEWINAGELGVYN